MDFTRFFRPASVALIGARPEEGHVGSAIMKNLLRAGDRRTIYPVTPAYTEVFGVPAYASLALVPAPIDLAVIAVRSDLVPEVLRECAAKKVGAAVVISAGFKEAGESGAALEKDLTEVGRAAELPFLGPNCLGVIDANTGLNASFALNSPLPGGISFLSQSGAIGTSFIEWSRSEGVGLAKFVSLGNEAGIAEVDMLEYLGNDPETKAILVYLEHISDGPKLLTVARDITKNKKKPIVLLRSGRSVRGSQAVMSHTGSLAPEDAIFSAAARQAGVATVTSLRELFNAAKLLTLSPDWGTKTRLAIVTNGGGPSVNAADLVELSESMDLVRFDEHTTAALRSTLPSMAAVGNPVDVIGDAGADRYKAALDIVGAIQDLDATIVIVTPQMMTDVQAIAETIVAANRVKPVIPVLMGGAVMAGGVRILQNAGLTNFDLPSDAIIALDALTPNKKSSSFKKTRGNGTGVLYSYEETQATLVPYDLAIFGDLARTRDDVAAIFERYRSPSVAMKVISRDVIHKTDIGAVRLNIKSVDEALRAWDEMDKAVHQKDPEVIIEGMLVQPMQKGQELIIGMKRDATFGPVVVFGLGGLFTELLNDVAMRVAPLTLDDAHEMMGEIAGARYLEGFRGAPAANKAALAELLVTIGRIAVERPEISEIDLNPVIATADRAYLVDVRLMRRSA